MLMHGMVVETKAAPSLFDGSIPDGLPPQEDPTERECEVLLWLARGKSDWEIGAILDISCKTVNFHVENVKRKFAVQTRIQAVLTAVRLGHLPL